MEANKVWEQGRMYSSDSPGTRIRWGEDKALLPMNWTADVALGIEVILNFWEGASPLISNVHRRLWSREHVDFWINIDIYPLQILQPL